MKSLIYIVYAQSYNENLGGVIFQHELVHQLRQIGEQAFLCLQEPIFKQRRRKRLKNLIFPPRLKLNPNLDTPIARPQHLKDPRAVVIYPEIVPGNPLGAKNVVRWLLYEPGGLLGKIEFGKRDMFFAASQMCDVVELTGGAPELFVWKVNPVYRNENRRDRNGICYIVRKGHGKARIPQTEVAGAVQIDDLPHHEVNDTFNRSSVFYSYDEATMYSQFAALTGCLSVVIPGKYPSRERWIEAHNLARFGVAYGLAESELEHARNTQDQVREMLSEKERSSIDTIRNFVALTRKRFQ